MPADAAPIELDRALERIVKEVRPIPPPRAPSGPDPGKRQKLATRST